MILSEILKKLLHKWDFDQAKSIYDEYGDSDTMKFLFAQPWTKMADDMLRECIQELSQTNPIVQHEVVEARRSEKMTAKDESSTPKVDSAKLPGRLRIPESEFDYPKELQELVLKRKGIFAEANHSRYLLFKEGTPEAERKRLAFLIKSNWREIERIWGILNYWKEHKALSPDLIQVQTGQMTVKEMTSRLKNLRSYISKAKSGKKKYKMTIEEMEAEKNELERRLNAIV
ncbi:hypothetical protein PBT90_16700 [Algoriphagus halophytocola]|uniref:hypothetical protein n=1 Tax=Algoriphagus halophytocola TaxID=2991499 RepID=UPI0022DDBCD0|nr:hypothetical protein [Algoriphagus sp. TR-M9]WBL42377.1 hypothetical protein PBT90_16700 [Algoriphagus sp. TR-M9]